MAPDSMADQAFMDAALGLARRGLGRVWPNPAVGCVIVQDGRVAGRGWTAPGGRPHAEAVALERAGAAAQGATAYVTLEPCAHHGRTPPCAEALAEAGVARVVTALADPDARTAGRGHSLLRDSGSRVVEGVGREAAAAVNAGFIKRVDQGKPLVTLKLATTLDGRIATATGESQWITGAAARTQGHRLRATHDAIVVGSGTAVADDPGLTCRLPGLEAASPVRVVMDGRSRLTPDSRLVRTAGEVPVWLVTRPDADADRRAALESAGVRVMPVAAGADGSVDVDAALTALGDAGLTRVLVEGGGTLVAALLRADAVDRITWFRAPAVLGADGRPGVAELGIEALDAMPRFVRAACGEAGSDLMETYVRRQGD